MTAPLLSLVAKARFVPGALPDHLFEQPKDGHNVPAGVLTEIPEENLGWAVSGTGGKDLEAGESSSLRRQISQRLGRGEVECGDRQQLLEPRVNMDSDALSHSETRDLPVESGDRQQLLEPRGNTDSDALSHYETLKLPASMMHGTNHSRGNPDAPKEGTSLETELPSHTNAAPAPSHAGGPSGSVLSAQIP